MSAISDTISRYVPFAPKKPKIDRKQALLVVPMRNPLIGWERKGKEVVLSIPTRDDRFARLFKRLVRNLPDKREIGLDEVGSSVWELCDGERNLDSIVGSVSKNYKLTRRETEASVTMFLQTLTKRGFIGLLSARSRSNTASGKEARIQRKDIGLRPTVHPEPVEGGKNSAKRKR